jgi:tetratricopeptide (TPR) repeat protein
VVWLCGVAWAVRECQSAWLGLVEPQAEAAWRRADDRGHAAGAYNLGVLLEQRGDLDDAEAAWRRADDRGHAAGAYNLGVLLEQRGDLDDAQAAWRRADDRGHAAGAYNLGVLLKQRGELAEAKAAWRRAAASDDEAVAARARAALEELAP